AKRPRGDPAGVHEQNPQTHPEPQPSIWTPTAAWGAQVPSAPPLESDVSPPPPVPHYAPPPPVSYVSPPPPPPYYAPPPPASPSRARPGTAEPASGGQAEAHPGDHPPPSAEPRPAANTRSRRTLNSWAYVDSDQQDWLRERFESPDSLAAIAEGLRQKFGRT